MCFDKVCIIISDVQTHNNIVQSSFCSCKDVDYITHTRLCYSQHRAHEYNMLDLRPEAQNKSTPEVVPNLDDTRNLPDYSQHTSSSCAPVHAVSRPTWRSTPLSAPPLWYGWRFVLPLR